MSDEQPWYSVKCVFKHDYLSRQHGEVVYEERIVVLKASSLDEAIALGEVEANAYAGDKGTVHYTGFISAFHMFERKLANRAEVYSLMRQSNMDTDAFLDHYYDDGSERTQHYDDGSERTQR